MNTVSPVLEFFSDYLTIVLCCFIVKHFLADFIFQTKFQYENKGNYGKLAMRKRTKVIIKNMFLSPLVFLLFVFTLLSYFLFYH